MTTLKLNIRIILTIFLGLFVSELLAQEVTISGIVRNSANKQPIAFATVGIKSTRIGTNTNDVGRFSLSLPKDINGAQLIISCVGYRSDTIGITNNKLIYNVLLRPINSALNEVVVTGVSRATLARENPIPIISVSTKKIEQATESNIIDVLVKNVPGLNAVKTGPNISKPFIRGLGYNRVLTLYDGIRQEGQQWGDEHGIEVDPYNIARAEVAKGPSSLIYGSDALAGVVGLIPAFTDYTDSKIVGKLFSEYQSNNGLIGNGIRLSYGNNHWSYALRGSYRIAKSYQNSIDGRVYNTGFRETTASGSIKYRNKKGHSSLNATLYNDIQGIPDGSRDSTTRKFTYQTMEGSDDDIFNREIVPEDILNSYRQSPLNQDIQHYRIYTKNHYELGKGDINALAAFQQNIRREYTHPTYPEQAGMYVRLNTVNYGIDYHVPILSEIDFSTGLNGMYQNNTNKNATDFPIPNYDLFDAGAYGFVKWKHDKWTIGGGIRYDHRSLKGSDFYTQTDSTTGFAEEITQGNTSEHYLQFPAFSKDFHGVSLSLGSTYALNDKVSLKANIARGYRAPSIPEFSSNGLDPGAHIIYLGNRNFEPEFSLQEDLGIEVGTNEYSASLSIFNNNISNYIFLSQLVDANDNPIVDAQGNKTYQYQQAKAQLYGLEANFVLHPSQWEGFEFAHSLAVTYAYNRSKKFEGAGLQGEFLPLVPPLHYVTSMSQEIKMNSKIFPAIKVNAEADFNGAQSRYLALNHTETFTPGYSLFNLGAGTSIKYSDKHTLQLQFQINNLFDKAYQSNLNRLKYFEYYSASPNGNLGIYNMGRNISFKAILSF